MQATRPLRRRRQATRDGSRSSRRVMMCFIIFYSHLIIKAGGVVAVRPQLYNKRGPSGSQGGGGSRLVDHQLPAWRTASQPASQPLPAAGPLSPKTTNTKRRLCRHFQYHDHRPKGRKQKNDTHQLYLVYIFSTSYDKKWLFVWVSQRTSIYFRFKWMHQFVGAGKKMMMRVLMGC